MKKSLPMQGTGPMDSKPLLQLRNLTIASASKLLVNQVGLDLFPAEIHLILGESGAGKSLCFKALAGLGSFFPELTFKGSMDWKDHELPLLVQRPHVGVSCLFQDALSQFNPVLSIIDHIGEVLGYSRGRKVKAAEAKEWIQKTVGDLGLDLDPFIWTKLPRELSGGMLQRVLLVLALAKTPELLLADEPFSALDPERASQAFQLMRKLAQGGMAIAMVSHDISLLEQVDRVSVLYAGRLLESFVPLARDGRGPRHPYTKALLACRPGKAATSAYPALGPMPEPGERHGLCPLLGWCPHPGAACFATMPEYLDSLACHHGNAQRPNHV